MACCSPSFQWAASRPPRSAPRRCEGGREIGLIGARGELPLLLNELRMLTSVLHSSRGTPIPFTSRFSSSSVRDEPAPEPSALHLSRHLPLPETNDIPIYTPVITVTPPVHASRIQLSHSAPSNMTSSLSRLLNPTTPPSNLSTLARQPLIPPRAPLFNAQPRPLGWGDETLAWE